MSQPAGTCAESKRKRRSSRGVRWVLMTACGAMWTRIVFCASERDFARIRFLALEK